MYKNSTRFCASHFRDFFNGTWNKLEDDCPQMWLCLGSWRHKIGPKILNRPQAQIRLQENRIDIPHYLQILVRHQLPRVTSWANFRTHWNQLMISYLKTSKRLQNEQRRSLEGTLNNASNTGGIKLKSWQLLRAGPCKPIVACNIRAEYVHQKLRLIEQNGNIEIMN